MPSFTESVVEEAAALAWLASAGWQVRNGAENATIWSAHRQLQTYQAEVPTLFASNALLAVSDGVEARVGTLGARREWFKPWRTVAGDARAGGHMPELQMVIEGLCAPRRFLDLLRDFIVFEDDGGTIVKRRERGLALRHLDRVCSARWCAMYECKTSPSVPRTTAEGDHRQAARRLIEV